MNISDQKANPITKSNLNLDVLVNAESISFQIQKKNKIKKEPFLLKDGTKITIYYVYPKSQSFHSLLFIPSLIGGSYMQEFNFFSNIVDEGFLFYSFHYRGHRGSNGLFSLQQALMDSLEVIQYVLKKFDNLALFGIGACFGSIPLLYSLNQKKKIFKKIALVNSIFSIQQICPPLEVLRYYLFGNNFKRFYNIKFLLLTITSTLFPSVDQSENNFGYLNYKKSKLFKVFFEYFFYNPLKQIARVDCPTLCCYGSEDSILKLNSSKNQSYYEIRFKKLFSNISFYKKKTNHFWENELSDLNQRIFSFFKES